MSEEHGPDHGCPSCRAREMALDWFDENVPARGSEEVNAFVNGLVQAATMVAAYHTVPGQEPLVRSSLQTFIAGCYDDMAAQAASLPSRQRTVQ